MWFPRSRESFRRRLFSGFESVPFELFNDLLFYEIYPSSGRWRRWNSTLLSGKLNVKYCVAPPVRSDTTIGTLLAAAQYDAPIGHARMLSVQR